MIVSRRTTLISGLVLGLGACTPNPNAASAGEKTSAPTWQPLEALAVLEARVGGRLGVAVVHSNGALAGHRLGERFGMCSTFKLPLVGIVLREVDGGRLALDKEIAFTKAEVLDYAPAAKANLARGRMSIRELAEAAQMLSDNTAANLLLRELGGPAGFTSRLRAIGDAVTRLDRVEPEMNLVAPGEAQDTTTPEAMARTALTLVHGDVLAPASRALLLDWMRRTETGLKRLRAGLPKDWAAGDKTGTGIASGLANKINDVAVAVPPGLAPLAIAAFYEAPGYFPRTREEDQAVLAEVGRIAAGWSGARMDRKG